MKICQLCAVDFTLYHFLLPLMRDLRERGHEVVGVCSEGALLEPVRAEGFRVETVAIARSYDVVAHLHTYRELRRLFEREGFDLLHVHTPVAALVGRLAGWRAAVPRIVYTAHGFYFHERMAWPVRRAFRALEWVGGRVTDVLLTQAEEDAEAARRYRLCRGGVIQAIGNGADPARFFPDDGGRARLRAEFGTPEDRVVILMVGRLVAEKGYPELIEAMRAVDAELWIVGERLASDHAGGIEALLTEAESDPVLNARMRLLGYRADVPALMQAADIFTLPSHREGMPRSIVEAMLSGLPVVASDIRGSREEVVGGETGVLVAVADAVALADGLNQLVADAGRRRRMGAAGRTRALELYDEVKVIERQMAVLGL